MITLSELHAEKARLVKQRDSAAAVYNQVCGAIMQTDALIARAEAAEKTAANNNAAAEIVADAVRQDANREMERAMRSGRIPSSPEPPEAA